MNSLSGASHPARSSKAAGIGVTLGALIVVAVSLSLLPWPRFITSGWMAGGRLALGGVAGNLIMGGKGLPEATDLGSAIRTSIGALVALSALLIAAAIGL
jgi:hypothetical protein